MIKINSFSYSYLNSKVPALCNIDLDFKKGQIPLITGRSGCGKSTLAYSICGLLKEGKSKGKITLDGKNVSKIEPYRLAEQIGLVQQDPDGQLCTLTVEDELAFGLENLCYDPAEIRARIKWALGVVKGEYLKDRDLLNLSGGEKQKVTLASILAMQPETIILDEPTANLDPKSTTQVQEALENLRAKTDTTAIILEHRVETFSSLATSLILMDKGKIIYEGHPSDIIDKREMLVSQGILLPKKVPRKNAVSRKRPLLKVRNLSYQVGNKKILEDITFDLNKSEIVGLMGDNGSGKTTLALHLLKFLDPDEGNIIFNGADISTRTTSALARDIGFVFQNPSHQMFEDTVDSEIMFGPTNFGLNLDSLKSRKLELVKKLGLDLLLPRSPHSLSYGQKRRLNIASILISAPRLAVLDEVFIGQDMLNVQLIMQILESTVKRGLGVLLIVHDPNLAARFCDRIMFIKNHKLIIDAPAENAFKELENENEKAYLPANWGCGK
jgi:energy-coupling factor transport system ATP-binding protein